MSLIDIAKKYTLDELQKVYMWFYGLEFDKRNDVHNILIVGLDDSAPLALWGEYFKSANIHGIDPDTRFAKYENEKTYIYTANIDDDSVLSSIVGNVTSDIQFVIVKADILDNSFKNVFQKYWSIIPDGTIIALENVGLSFDTEIKNTVRSQLPGGCWLYNRPNIIENKGNKVCNYINKNIAPVINTDMGANFIERPHFEWRKVYFNQWLWLYKKGIMGEG